MDQHHFNDADSSSSATDYLWKRDSLRDISLINGGVDDSFREGSGTLYFSSLPLRSQLLRETYRFLARRLLFYLMLAYFLVATLMFPFLITNLTFWFWLVHILWFDLDLSTNKSNLFIQLLHALSFVGAYIVMITATILLVILNPGFIAERARIEHHSVAFAWLLNILIHYVPPVILTLDLLLSTKHIRKRHRLHLNYRGNNSRRRSRLVRDVIKVVWAYCAPIGLVGIWLASGFTIEGVYGVTNYSMNYLAPIMVVTDIIFATLFLYLIRKKKPDNYIILND